jgi:uncharacterized protein (DUF697 family)
MPVKKLLRLSGTAGIISAVLDLAGALLAIAVVIVPAIPLLSHAVLSTAANVLLVFLLMGIYGCQIEESGTQGLAGFAISVIGLLLGLARFFSPLGWLLFLVGVCTLSLANTRTARLPRGAMWFWAVATLLSIGLPYTGVWLLSAVLCRLLTMYAKLQIGRSLRSLALDESP